MCTLYWSLRPLGPSQQVHFHPFRQEHIYFPTAWAHFLKMFRWPDEEILSVREYLWHFFCDAPFTLTFTVVLYWELDWRVIMFLTETWRKEHVCGNGVLYFSYVAHTSPLSDENKRCKTSLREVSLKYDIQLMNGEPNRQYQGLNNGKICVRYSAKAKTFHFATLFLLVLGFNEHSFLFRFLWIRWPKAANLRSRKTELYS